MLLVGAAGLSCEVVLVCLLLCRADGILWVSLISDWKNPSIFVILMKMGLICQNLELTYPGKAPALPVKKCMKSGAYATTRRNTCGAGYNYNKGCNYVEGRGWFDRI